MPIYLLAILKNFNVLNLFLPQIKYDLSKNFHLNIFPLGVKIAPTKKNEPERSLHEFAVSIVEIDLEILGKVYHMQTT